MKKTVFSLTIGVAAAFLIQDVTSADITHSLSFSSNDVIFSEKGEYDVVEMEGCNFSTDIVGAPQLPAKVIQLVIPQDAEVESIAITGKTSEKIDGDYYIYPLQPPAKTDGSPPPYFVAPDPYWYTSNLPYPPKVIELVGSGYRSEYHIVTLKVYPLQYTPADSSLVLHTYISFSVKTNASPNRGVPVYRRR